MQDAQGMAKEKKERATTHLAPVEQKAGISRQKRNRTIPRSYWCRGFFLNICPNDHDLRKTGTYSLCLLETTGMT
jgi:hypothetical protein